MKNISSKDKRKPAITIRLKHVSGGNKVTLVKESDTHYEGHCLKHMPDGKYQKLGTFKIEKMPEIEALKEEK